MQIYINGEACDFDGPIDISSLLEGLSLGQRRLAVELNGTIIPRSLHALTRLTNGDKLEIVIAVGGG